MSVAYRQCLYRQCLYKSVCRRVLFNITQHYQQCPTLPKLPKMNYWILQYAQYYLILRQLHDLNYMNWSLWLGCRDVDCILLQIKYNITIISCIPVSLINAADSVCWHHDLNDQTATRVTVLKLGLHRWKLSLDLNLAIRITALNIVLWLKSCIEVFNEIPNMRFPRNATRFSLNFPRN